jgi:hypothetical protein
VLDAFAEQLVGLGRVMTTPRKEERVMDTALDRNTGGAGWVELGKRAASGLEVALLWNRSSNRVKVAVSDNRVCHHLDFEVARADALSAFYHPFAYATSRLAHGAPAGRADPDPSPS